MNSYQESKAVNYLAFGLASVTLFVYTNKISDPVNAPKLLLLGVVAICSAVIFILPNFRYIWNVHKFVVSWALLMIASMVIATINSESPVSQNLYGVQGRNTGLLDHFALLLILISLLSLKGRKSIRAIFFGFLAAGGLNGIYCLWVMLFGDFIGWTNPYKSLLGTLGNPNFISSLLAMATVGAIALFFIENLSKKKILLLFALLALSITEILKTNSIQGLVVLSIGLYLIVLLVLTKRIRRRWLTFTYVSLGLMGGSLGLLGLLHRGPLTQLLFQETLAYRKEYWLAGINMGMKYPLSGVGMDSYGDWYRQLRTAKSVISPGLDVITNVSHNVLIDSFATGGFPLLICHLAIFGLTLKSIFKVTLRKTNLDPLFVAISITWICYQIQSLISINQIGIAVWGWTLSGLVIAYEKISPDAGQNQALPTRKNSRKSQSSLLLTPMILLVAVVIGFLVYSPPLVADNKWTVAYSNKNADQLFSSLENSYFTPSNSFKYAQAIQIFENSNFPDKAHELARRAVKFNPRSFEAWQMLYNIKNSSSDERRIALSMMIKLDPRNKKLRDLQK